MTITVNTPDGSRFNFPDGTTQPEIDSALDAHFGGGGGGAKAPGEDVTAGMALSGVPLLGAFVPKAEAAIRAAANPLTGVGEPGASFSERYAKNLPLREADYRQAETESPVLSTGLKVGGGVAALAPLGATAIGARAMGLTGSTLPRMIGAGAASGAALTGADSALRGEDPTTGAGIGGFAGAAGPVAGRVIGAGVRGVRNAFSAAAPQVATDVAGVRVPLTRGQATGDVTAQMEEQAALRGASGEGPQRVARGFFEGEQGPAVEQARGAIGQRLDRFGQTIADDPLAAAELASESTRNVERASRANYQRLYNDAYAVPGEFDPGAFRQTGASLRNRLSAGQSPVIVDEVTTPVANRMLADVDEQLARLNIPNAAQPAAGGSLPLDMRGLDQARKRLVSMASAAQSGGADRRAAGRIIGAFDQHVDDALSAGLFSGDDRALDTLRSARAAYTQHRQLFRSQGAGDDVGRAMERVIGRNGQQGATPTEVANYLYGEARVGGTGLSVRLSHRMQQVLGQDSPEWSAIRQGMWSRLSETTAGTTAMGPQRAANRISEFMNGSGRPLAQSMFTAPERALMERYAALQRQLTPRAGAVNTSNTAGTLRMLMAGTARQLFTAIGAGAGGIPGAMAGAAAGGVARRFTEGGATRSVARSLRGAPRHDPADQAFAQQMAQYGAVGSRALAPQEAQ
jgi:hypothetical protein